MTEGVQNFLSRLGLDGHLEMFMARGFDSEDDIPHLQDADLDAMYITNQDERSKILEAAPHYKPSKEYILYDWLRSKGLDHYFISFVQSELVDLPEIARLNLPDDDLYDELEITLPGHKRRLERAVQSLAKQHRTTLPAVSSSGHEHGESEDIPPSLPEPEMPVAYGRWGKPRCLADAKFDFLLIDATVVSTIDSRDRVHIEFMVDSGSDVVTLRQEVLDTMDLELIGPINSKGVHGSKVKNLYKANILVGDQSVEIEVMGESYDSIGSRVIRHFRHYISGSRHIWLKGDFAETSVPSKSIKPALGSQLEVSSTSAVRETTPSTSEDIEAVISPEIDEEFEEENTESIAESHLDKEDLHVQKDSVKLDGKIIENGFDENTIVNGVVSDIKFSFTKQAESVNNVSEEDTHDETDKLFGGTDVVIDIRPLIAASRKRHASNSVGIDPSQIDKRPRGRRSERRERQLQKVDNSNNIKPTGDSMNQVDTKDHGKKVKLRTVLSQRSVYYRSQEKDGEQNDDR